MARRNSKPVVQSETTEAPAEVENTTEEITVTDVTTEAPVETVVPATTEAPVKAPVAEADFGPFQAAVDAALEGKDSATGEVAPAFIAPVQEAFRHLEGAKNKNKAKAILNEGMKDAMGKLDIQTARAYMTLSDGLTVAAAHVKAERIPSDPTEAFIQRVVGLRLATDLATSTVPEGVKEDWRDQANALFTTSSEVAIAYLAWSTRGPVEEGAEDAPEPEATAFVKAAVKLAQGKSGKIGGKAGKSGTGTPFTGERRDISKHLAEAFASKAVGDFLTVSEIKNFKSDEYGDNPPSAGAISARLFPKGGGNCTLEGVTPATSADGKGNKGAVKA